MTDKKNDELSEVQSQGEGDQLISPEALGVQDVTGEEKPNTPERPVPPSITLTVNDVPLTDEDILARYSHPSPPPPPGSLEEKLFIEALGRQRVRKIEVNRRTTAKDLEEVIEAGDAVDAGERARLVVQITQQLKKNNRRRAWLVFWAGWVFSLLLLGGLGYGGFAWGMKNVAYGRHTVPVSCKIPFGDTELDARRYLSYPTRTLGGVQWTYSDWTDEEVEVVLKGDPLIVLGIDKKGKPWRKEFGKGDMGVAKLPQSDMYWLVGKSIKETTPVAHENFCK